MDSEPLPTTPWRPKDLVNPHRLADKAVRVKRMFAAIAGSYDLNNHLHSLGLDWYWRRVAVKMAELKPSDVVADIACGTGDLTLALARAKPRRVLGIDFCRPMLEQALRKSTRHANERLDFYQGDALRLPLADRSVDVVGIAFGIRNVADWGRAIDEFFRVLKPSGRLIILEFTLPRRALLRNLYNFYFRKILPRTATLISGDRTGAYQYLPESVNSFINPEQMRERLGQAGFQEVRIRRLTGGVCACYRGVRVA